MRGINSSRGWHKVRKGTLWMNGDQPTERSENGQVLTRFNLRCYGSLTSRRGGDDLTARCMKSFRCIPSHSRTYSIPTESSQQANTPCLRACFVVTTPYSHWTTLGLSAAIDVKSTVYDKYETGRDAPPANMQWGCPARGPCPLRDTETNLMKKYP